MRDDLEITKQDAINILRHCSATDPDLSRCDTCIATRRCDEYFSSIAELLENGTCGWIPVTERLPEPDEEVLLIANGQSGRMYYIGCLHHVEAGKSWLTGITSKESDWNIWGWSYLKEPNVTHWMPLPEPPEEGNQCKI